MNNEFDELTKNLAQSVGRRQALKGSRRPRGHGAGALVGPARCRCKTGLLNEFRQRCRRRRNLPVRTLRRPCAALDRCRSSFRDTEPRSLPFRNQSECGYSGQADPGLTPAVNHLGSTFGILTDRKTAGHFNFFGHQESYYFNFLVGALDPVADSGVGLGLGWHGFLQGPNGFTEIPLAIRGDTMIFETSAESLGNPAAFEWSIGSECDPVPIPEETPRPPWSWIMPRSRDM